MEDISRKEKLRLAGIARYGSEEAWRADMKRRGMTARRDTPRGFARMDKERVKEASKKGLQSRWGSSAQSTN